MSATETETSPAGNEAVGFGASYQRLRAAQKSSKGAPAYSLYVNRPVGRVFAAAAHQLGMTPNQVTAISGAVSFVGIICLALLPATWWTGLLVALALVLGYALDSADGQLARLRGGGSVAGEWLDHMIDSAKISSLHVAVLITAYRNFDLPQGWLLVPLGFLVVSNVFFFGFILVDQLGRIHRAQHGLAAPPKATSSALRTLVKIPTDYGFLAVSFVLLGAPLVFFGVYTLLGLGSAGYLALAAGKWYHDTVALDDAPGEA